MSRLQNKIIAVLILAVLLPLLPLSLLVYQLVNQSYRVGVNPQVAQALKAGLAFSKAQYDLERQELSQALEALLSHRKFHHPGQIPAPLDTAGLALHNRFWIPRELFYFDAQGRLLWKRSLQEPDSTGVDPRVFQEFRPGQLRLVVSDRYHNRFLAVRRVGTSSKPSGFLVLSASMNPKFLQQANQILQVHQVYQSLNLSRHSIPQRFLIAFVALGLVFLLLAVMAGIWISARITAPFSMLARGTEEIGKGNLDYRLPDLKRKDEAGQLVRHFNQMAQALQENQRRLIYLEKMALWQQIASKLAHEIKNPLTPIQLTLQQLVDQYDNRNPEYAQLLQECSQIIQEEIGSLRRLVHEFSEFGRLPKLNLQENDLRELLNELQTLYSQRVQLVVTQPLPRFYFDHDGIRRVFINLIENALQADPGGHPILIETKILDNRVRISVQDRGTGIPAENRSKIFEPYFSTRKGGMGLGLAITRMIVEEHQGHIWVESQLNRGTTFFIELPLNLSSKETDGEQNENTGR